MEELEQCFTYNDVSITRYEIKDNLGYNLQGVEDEVMQDLVEEIYDALVEEYGECWSKTIDDSEYWNIVDNILGFNRV